MRNKQETHPDESCTAPLHAKIHFLARPTLRMRNELRIYLMRAFGEFYVEKCIRIEP